MGDTLPEIGDTPGGKKLVTLLPGHGMHHGPLRDGLLKRRNRSDGFLPRRVARAPPPSPATPWTSEDLICVLRVDRHNLVQSSLEQVTAHCCGLVFCADRFLVQKNERKESISIVLWIKMDHMIQINQ